MKDREIECKECGKFFTFTAGEQKFFADKGFEEPKRCPKCRQIRKDTRPPLSEREIEDEREES